MRARLAHYIGIHLLNQKQWAAAEAKLHEAQDAYVDPELEPVPYEALHSEPTPRPVRNRFDVNASAQFGAARMPGVVSVSRVTQPALLGLIEVLRYRVDRAPPSQAGSTRRNG